jgi:hypothetical protein
MMSVDPNRNRFRGLKIEKARMVFEDSSSKKRQAKARTTVTTEKIECELSSIVDWINDSSVIPALVHGSLIGGGGLQIVYDRRPQPLSINEALLILRDVGSSTDDTRVILTA